MTDPSLAARAVNTPHSTKAGLPLRNLLDTPAYDLPLNAHERRRAVAAINRERREYPLLARMADQEISYKAALATLIAERRRRLTADHPDHNLRSNAGLRAMLKAENTADRGELWGLCDDDPESYRAWLDYGERRASEQESYRRFHANPIKDRLERKRRERRQRRHSMHLRQIGQALGVNQ
jgi:hypothetical protein